MTWIADLAPCDYFPVSDASSLRAIGWLDDSQPFTTGATPREVYDRLADLLRNPWQPLYAAGPHECNLCQFAGPHGSANLFVPGNGLLYVCPELITHYINGHGYRPPADFCAAVTACPDTRTVAYKKAFLENAGRKFVQNGMPTMPSS